jgi:hypothetical protein
MIADTFTTVVFVTAVIVVCLGVCLILQYFGIIDLAYMVNYMHTLHENAVADCIIANANATDGSVCLV